LGYDDEGISEISAEHTCFYELGKSMAIIFIINIFKNIMEIGLPWVKQVYRSRQTKIASKSLKYPLEKLREIVKKS
jgi:hypothetical protein